MIQRTEQKYDTYDYSITFVAVGEVMTSNEEVDERVVVVENHSFAQIETLTAHVKPDRVRAAKIRVGLLLICGNISAAYV